MKKQLANSNWQIARNAFPAFPKKNSPRRHGTEKNQIMMAIARGWLSLWETSVAVLQEVFDESAYERFLHRTQAERSVESYRVFLTERESAIARKPRCC